MLKMLSRGQNGVSVLWTVASTKGLSVQKHRRKTHMRLSRLPLIDNVHLHRDMTTYLNPFPVGPPWAYLLFLQTVAEQVAGRI